MRLLSMLFFGSIIMLASFIVGVVFALVVNEEEEDIRYDY